MAPRRPVQERLADSMKIREQRRGIRPRDAAILIAVAWVLAIVLWGVLERLVDPHTFPNVWLGMWWALQTVTTVGYGDIVPASTAGKIIGSFLLLGGLAFLTVIIAMITGNFVARYQRKLIDEGDDPYAKRIDALRAELEQIRVLLSEQQGGPGPG